MRNDYRVAFGTLKGPVRPDNQDDYLLYEPQDPADFARHGRLFAVADGMGGGPGGAEASRTALRALLAAYLDTGPALAIEARLESAFHSACDALQSEAERRPELEGMGTTLTAVVLQGGTLQGVHVGDSRCLLLHQGKTRWLTSLHTTGDHRLTRAIGTAQRAPEPETFEARLEIGDRLLLMTDGFWHSVSARDCLATLQSEGLERAAERLLRRAQDLDGTDNATVIALQRTRESSDGWDDVRELRTEHGSPGLPHVGSSRFARLWPWALLFLGAALAALAAATGRSWLL